MGATSNPIRSRVYRHVTNIFNSTRKRPPNNTGARALSTTNLVGRFLHCLSQRLNRQFSSRFRIASDTSILRLVRPVRRQRTVLLRHTNRLFHRYVHLLLNTNINTSRTIGLTLERTNRSHLRRIPLHRVRFNSFGNRLFVHTGQTL